eukprot:gene8191-9729_t
MGGCTKSAVGSQAFCKTHSVVVAQWCDTTGAGFAAEAMAAAAAAAAAANAASSGYCIPPASAPKVVAGASAAPTSASAVDAAAAAVADVMPKAEPSASSPSGTTAGSPCVVRGCAAPAVVVVGSAALCLMHVGSQLSAAAAAAAAAAATHLPSMTLAQTSTASAAGTAPGAAPPINPQTLLACLLPQAAAMAGPPAPAAPVAAAQATGDAEKVVAGAPVSVAAPVVTPGSTPVVTPGSTIAAVLASHPYSRAAEPATANEAVVKTEGAGAPVGAAQCGYPGCATLALGNMPFCAAHLAGGGPVVPMASVAPVAGGGVAAVIGQKRLRAEGEPEEGSPAARGSGGKKCRREGCAKLALGNTSHRTVPRRKPRCGVEKRGPPAPTVLPHQEFHVR